METSNKQEGKAIIEAFGIFWALLGGLQSDTGTFRAKDVEDMVASEIAAVAHLYELTEDDVKIAKDTSDLKKVFDA